MREAAQAAIVIEDVDVESLRNAIVILENASERATEVDVSAPIGRFPND